MAGNAELMTGDPRWYNFLPGPFPLAYFFAKVEAGGAHGRDTMYSIQLRHHNTGAMHKNFIDLFGIV